MSLPAVLTALRKRIVRAGSLRQAAKALGVSPAYLSDVMRGQRRPGPTLLKQVGYTASRDIITTYSRTRQEAPDDR